MEAEEVFEQLDGVQVVDVREIPEWRAGRIEGAVHIPLATLPSRLDELDSEIPVILVCRSGARSARATMFLRHHGFDAHNLEGGMQAWARAGLAFSAHDGGHGRVV